MIFEFLKAGFLGLIEGITEFLPISSTGHLILAGELIGFTGERAKTFEIFIQLGAILSVVWLYRRKIFVWNSQTWPLVKNVLIAFLPAAIVGFLIHDFVKEVLFTPVIVAVSLITGGFLIFAIEYLVRRFSVESIEKITLKKSFAVGMAQILALVPGVSRSGATILGGMVTGMNRRVATEFSFFLAIPTMFAATLYDLVKSASFLEKSDFPLFAAGF